MTSRPFLGIERVALPWYSAMIRVFPESSVRA